MSPSIPLRPHFRPVRPLSSLSISLPYVLSGNFVTSSQAQRKWVSKIISKVSSGAYQIGANSANIIVQDRATGQLQEEKMASYVRFGIRVLYKGARSRMEGSRGQFSVDIRSACAN